jgi:ABC-type transport system substrate-binding protein
VVVTRWDDYPGTVIPFLENKGPAYVDAIRWVVILEESNRSNEVETGSVDCVRLPAPQDIDRLQANEDLVVIEFTDLGNFFLALNWTKEDLGFADPRVHQAISHAIDRQALVDTLYFGHAVPTPGPLYPSYKWYQSEVEAFNAFDPERSNSLLEEAGVGSMSFEVWTQPLPIQVRMLEAVSGMLADVGIDMSIRQLENVEFFPGLPESDAFTFKWLFNGEVAAIQFFMKFPSVEYYGDVPQSRQAIIDWENAGTLEEYERTDRALQVVFAEELPYIPILSPTNVYVHNKRVHGLRPNGQMIYPQFNDVWVEQ